MTDTALAQLRHLYQNMVNGAVRDTASAKRMAEGLLALAIEVLERGTPPMATDTTNNLPSVPDNIIIELVLAKVWKLLDELEEVRSADPGEGDWRKLNAADDDLRNTLEAYED